MAGARRQGRLTRSHHTTLLAISFLLLFACTVQATCYYPNGDIAYNDAPCKTNGEHSLCCGVGYACMKSGVCQLSQDTPSQLGSTGFVRGSCTDKSWNEPACPMFCLDPEINNVGGYNELGKCYDRPEDMYYCIDSVHNKLVCGNTTAGALYFVGPPATVAEIRSLSTTYSITPKPSTSKAGTTTFSSATTTSSGATTPAAGTAVEATTSSTPPATPAPSPNTPAMIDNTNGNNNTAIIAGVTAGVIGGLIVGGTIVWFILRRRKQHQQQQSSAAQTGQQLPPTAANFPITINNINNNDGGSSKRRSMSDLLFPHHGGGRSDDGSKHQQQQWWWWWYHQQQHCNPQHQQQYQQGLGQNPHNAAAWHHGHPSQAPSSHSGQGSFSSSGSTAVFHEVNGGLRSPQELPADQKSWL